MSAFVSPPRLALRFLNWFLKKELQEEVNGDLEEKFQLLLKGTSLRHAQWLFWLQVFNYLRPFAIRDNLITDLNPFFMFRSHWKIAWRSLWKQKRYSLLNLLGMTVGLACFIMLTFYIQYESSYDQQHTKANRIYRVAQTQYGNTFQGTDQFALAPSVMVPTLLEEYPEVETGTTISFSNTLFIHDQEAQYEYGLFADSAFFTVFDHQTIEGNLTTALHDKEAVILTSTMAEKYFGSESPLGQTLLMENERPLIVKAVVADPPSNQHFDFDFITNLTNYGPYKSDFERYKWVSNSYWAYIVLPAEYDYQRLTEKLAPLTERAKAFYTSFSFYPEYFLQPLTDIHLRSHLNMEIGNNGNITHLYLAAAIAIVILLLALINYINLTTARAGQRVREVGVRKVLGAKRRQVIGQFFLESAIVVGLSASLAIILSVFLWPSFNKLMGLEMPMRWLGSGRLLLGAATILGGLVICAGLYPAFLSSLTAPVSAIRGDKLRAGGKRQWLGRALVVGQFAAAIILATGSIIIYQQLRYIQDKNLGYSRDHIVYIPYQDQEVMDKMSVLKSELLQHPGIEKVAMASQVPLQTENQGIADEWEGNTEGAELPIYRNWVDYEYLDLFDMEIVAGRKFSPDHPTDATEAYLLNESAVKALGWDDAIGKQFEEGHVIGVVKDFHFQPFNLAIEPMFIRIHNEYTARYGTIVVKIRANQQQEAITQLEESMRSILPLVPYNMRFMDESYDKLYQTEIRFGQAFTLFTGLAIFIACLGLLGLVTHQVLQRTKEIGIRKVLGASVGSIVRLISSGFLWQVTLAAVIAAPIAWWGMQQWLENFAYRIDLKPWVFLAVGGVTILVAFFTVSSQSIRAALANPVQAIKTE